jgi:hypothetical protein
MSGVVIATFLLIAACGGGGGEGGGGGPAVAAPAAPVLALLPQGIKTFRFTWADVSGETEYRLLESPDGSAAYNLVATLAADASSHEHAVFLPARINARYILRACNAGGCADSAAVQAGGTLAAVGYVKASNTGADDQLGTSIALSADGSTLAVGAMYEDSSALGIDGNPADNSAADSGAVYVFTRGAGTWSQQAYVKASNTRPGQAFGWRVALAADGSTLAVGAPLEASNATGMDGDQHDVSAIYSGAVYVFTRSAGSWSQQAYVKASNTARFDFFGFGLALSADGNTLAVGAPSEDSNANGVNGDESNNSATDSGAVYVFTRSAGIWSQQAYVKASHSEVADRFGIAVALAADGSTLAVGANGEDSNATGIDGDQANNAASSSGAAYVFTRSAGVWAQQAYVKASNTGAGDGFGASMALSANGDTLAVGAMAEASNARGINGNAADNSAADSGAVFVFTRSAGSWSPQAYVKASNADTGDLFGYSIALAADGNTLAVGARGERASATGLGGNSADNSLAKTGAAYVFTRSAGVWAELAYVKASNSGQDDLFGESVALAADGGTLAVAASGEAGSSTGVGGNQADDSAPASGAVYLY